MKILHSISSINIAGGGPSKSVTELAIGQANYSESVTLFTKYSQNPFLKESTNKNLNLYFVKQSLFRNALHNLVKNEKFDLMHGHGIWQMPVHNMASIAIEKKIPYIMSPRGMLEPWSLEQSKLKKKIALALYQYKDLEKSACIHATSKMEADNIRKLGFKNPIAIIPNGLNLSEFSIKARTQTNDVKTILFLSRIHPKKGIELLIEAWTKLDSYLRNGWQINIAGNGDEKYINALQELISQNNFANEIKIIGSKFGKDKIDAYYNSDLFVLPTYSENFGMVVAEALACGIPVITTKGAPWQELKTHNAGWWIDIGAEPLAEALTDAMHLNDDERMQMGLNGRKLVEENYSIEIIAKKMITLYEYILYKSVKPDFII